MVVQIGLIRREVLVSLTIVLANCKVFQREIDKLVKRGFLGVEAINTHD